MIGKNRFSRWLVLAVILTVAEGATLFALTAPAQAQFRDERFPFLSRQRPSQGGGFFGGLFGPSNRPSALPNNPFQQQPQYRTDDARAPAPHKPDPNEQVVPTTSIVVMGDGMADWLAYGLEDAFSDSPEVAIIRKHKTHSGLLRYEAKGDLDWWHVARDQLAPEKPSYVVMMLGVADRQNIRERDLPKEDPKAKDDNKAKSEPDKTAADQSTQNADKADESDQSILTPESSRARKPPSGVIEFRSDRWAEIYSKRIDDTIAALKSKGVPVFWVGLPSIRGPKSTADAVYLNDLYRARAQRAGAVYVDVWEGFVDETGKFSSFGPDYEGQMRRLRSNDGVYFTRFGARKIAHYVEREIRRFMSNRVTPVALPTGPVAPAPDSKSAVRPVAGPVVPLTVSTGNADEPLLGGSASQPMHSDAMANRVLVNGEPVAPPPGRADDFAWQAGTESRASAPVTASPAALNEPANATPATAAPQQSKRGSTTAQATGVRPNPANNAAPRPPQQHDVPRPPPPIRQSNGPFGWFR
jgi:uncharacterized protein